ncbi:flavin monoamine oxidase family protein [Anaerobacillus alkaliphilus]|uniref:flavin monoamine oxidase family protein n=1 Tax=Anaerobacillus alkaliphilus TaxID=1548597 RepID=UPI0019D5A649|nr:NAD(P)/FAD-dependent oxidoreductase [Anaerobacillus alkaliphilus]
MSSAHEVDVVIIGAGLAGLAAALELQKRNISFVVLEASERPGGRVYSLQTKDRITIDLGAQWIEKEHVRMKKLLSQFGLKTVSTYKEGNSIYKFRDRVTKGKLPPLSASGYLDFLQFTVKLNKVSKALDSLEPWESEHAKDLDKITMEQFLLDHTYTASAGSVYKYLLEEMICCNLHEVSALDLLWCVKTAGSVNKFRNSEDIWIKDGVGMLVNKIAKRIEDRIYYRQPVTRITYEEGGASVKTMNGGCWKGKRVIVAIPPNLQAKIHYQPPLPFVRAQLLERSGLPSVIKAVIIYKKPFWREKGLSGIINSDTGPINETADSSPKDGRRGVLTVLITGDSARAEVNANEILAELVPFLGNEALEPLEVYLHNWSEQEWTRGGYGVHFAPGVLTSYGKALIDPVACIHWAGTETATEWRLFMEGAVQSGERAAFEVIEQIRC